MLGIVLLDLAVQGAHISNQSEVYRLRPEARSRLTTAYMCVNFMGGVVGSASSAWVYGVGGWSAVCSAGVGFLLKDSYGHGEAAIGLWLTEARWPLRTMRHPPPTSGAAAPLEPAVATHRDAGRP